MNLTIVINIAFTAAYLFWGPLVLIGVMLQGGPNPGQSKLTTIAFLMYPIYLALINFALPHRYFGVSPLLHLVIVTGIVLLGLWGIGFLRS